jgi:TrmH family RNA methyltransferase
LPDRLALIVSNEGAGLSPHLAQAVHRRLRIPMAPMVESLNVAAATAIVLYALGVAHPVARSS